MVIDQYIFSFIARLLGKVGGVDLNDFEKREKLCQLYGASYTFSINQKGMDQIASYSIKVVQPHFLKGKESPSWKALKLLSDLIFHPSRQDGWVFDSKRIKEEIETFRHTMKRTYSDPSSILKSRCLSYMGYDSEKIDFSSVSQESKSPIQEDHIYEAYEKILRLPIHIHIIGDVNPNDYSDEVLSWFTSPSPKNSLENSFESLDRANSKLLKNKQHSLMIEHGNFHQCKLSIAYKTHVTYGSPNFAALFVFHKLFASGPMSKLNFELRRRKQLVYEVMSELDRFRQLIHINTSTTVGNTADILLIIDKELKLIAEGRLDKEEVTRAVEGVLHYMKVGMDLPEQEIDVHLDQCLTETNMNSADFIELINTVTVEEITQIANNLEKAITWVLFPNEPVDKSGKGA